jgi:molybdenum cofactor cytidylyltransferase
MIEGTSPGTGTRGRIAAVVPAAGQSTRFGTMKLLADVGGAPLLERTLASLLDAGVARVVVVTRAGEAFEGVPSMADPRVSAVVNPEPARGMFSSIQAGLAAAAGDVVLVLPADMPFVAAQTVAAVIARAADAGMVVVPVHHARRGHPLAIPRRLCDTLLALEPTTTLKDALAASGASMVLLDVADPGVLRDVDVPADLAPDAR